MKISPSTQSFVLHFGEMGSRWGFNRTVGQIYALIVMNEAPLNADDLADGLSISRGNVSMGIKELLSWRLIKRQHVPGDRKEYFTADGSIWDMGKKVLEERRKRELDPTLSLLRDLLMREADNENEAYALQQMQEIHDLLEMISQWTEELQRMKPESLRTLMKLGSGVGKVLNVIK
ncbi:hypothetical protein TDB9533_04003 [Thalassocella blandensis]|nr:hypothetical protein TDB9533_04003 [Thalassocella blandensis]